MKLKAKNGNEAVIEKFVAQSCKTAKYAKSVVKKRELSELRPNGGSNIDAQSAAGGITVTTVDGTQITNNTTTAEKQAQSTTN